MKKPVMIGAKISVAPPTIFHWSYLPAEEVLTQASANIDVAAIDSRQDRRDETIFTSELSSNAAFRSLAPPVSLS